MESKYLEMVEGKIVINADTLRELDNLREWKKTCDAKLKELTDGVSKEIRAFTGDKPIRVSDYNLVKKGGNWTYAFSEEMLKANYPEIYDKCLIPIQEKVSFSLVYAKREKKVSD